MMTSSTSSGFEVVKELGAGAFGVVYLIQRRESEEKFALKNINMHRMSSTQIKGLQEEADLLERLNHRHVVAYITSYMLHKDFVIITEFCEGGDLASYLEDRATAPLPEDLIVCWLAQTTLALRYLHDNNVLHRDLKPQNIFLSRDGDVKLGDLGLARVLAHSRCHAQTYAGTPLYMSPEIFSRRPYNHKTDIWSLGCVLCDMMTVHYKGSVKRDDRKILISRLFGLRGKGPTIDVPTMYSTYLRRLLEAMMQWEPTKRPSAKRVLCVRPVSKYLKEAKRPRDIIDVTKSAPVVCRSVDPAPVRRQITDKDVQFRRDSLKIYRERRRQLEADFVDGQDDVDSVDGKVETEDTQDDLDIIPESESETEGDADDGRIPVEVYHLLKALTDSNSESDEDSMEESQFEDFERRVHLLRSQLTEALGESVLEKACSVLDVNNDKEDLQEALSKVLGQANLEKYGDKIVYLRLFQVDAERPR